MQLIERTNPTTGEVFKFTDDEFKATCQKVLCEWENAKDKLEAAKAEEMRLRKEYVALASDPNQDSGTERIALDSGDQAKITKKLIYGWKTKTVGGAERVDYTAIEGALEKIEETIEGGALIAERLVKWKAELSLTEYKQLPPAAVKIIDKVIVTKDGAPTLEIVTPKR